ncbi:MAG TPA: aldehyde dehydrogenase, partial [Flavisolibacter sp.]|nr:aldehyde dehydrogenase [Flavisolibacter sp.]
MQALSQLQNIRGYFNGGATQSYAFRKQKLEALRAAILANEETLMQALYEDLKKSKEESWVTEIGFVLAEIRHTLKHLKKWMKPERVATNLLNLPSRSYVYKEPLGVVLIIAPWNYPFQLLFAPLVGAIAGGNCVVLKPSEVAPATAAVMKQMIEQAFSPDYVLYAEGEGARVVPELMNSLRFDHVFYTGSTAVGKSIYEMAAKQLVPVTLELGGKSPCVVESDATIKVTARRIAMTKFSNAGQMCVAPDYVLVHKSVKDALVKEMIEAIKTFFGEQASGSYNYGKIINEKAFSRLVGYLNQGNVLYGGKMDAASRYIEPTLLENVPLEAAIMGDEIFGPVLPIITFETFEEAKAIINRNPAPLAFYVFTSSKEKEERWLRDVPFGGGCVNNAAWHLTNFNLPFGGRGNSGIGGYHGKYSFDIFTHKKAVMKTPTWFDPAIKYPPFKGKLNLFKKI